MHSAPSHPHILDPQFRNSWGGEGPGIGPVPMRYRREREAEPGSVSWQYQTTYPDEAFNAVDLGLSDGPKATLGYMV